MAAPVVTGVTFKDGFGNPISSVSPGDTGTVTVAATDPDPQGSADISGTAFDGAGLSTPFSFAGAITVTRPVTLQNLADSLGVMTFTPTANPLVYNFSVA